MADTLLEVVNRVRRVLGLPVVTSFSDSDESLSNVQDVNECYLDLLRKLPDTLPMLQDASGGTVTTADGTRLYALDTDARPMHLWAWSFENETSGDIPLTLATREYIQKKDPRFDEVTGQPEIVYLEGNSLGIYPVPDGVYSLKYQFKSPFTRLSATTDTFLIPDEWLPYVECYAQFLYEDRKGFGNPDRTAARMRDKLGSVLAEAELLAPSYFLPEVHY